MKRILIIEDELEMLRNLTTILRLEKFHPLSAENGRVGVDLAKKQKPDLILCDVTMPGLDGYGVIAALRADAETVTILFIFLTAKAEKLDIRAGMNLGADPYLTKPVAKADLLAAICSRLESKKIGSMWDVGLVHREGNRPKHFAPHRTGRSLRESLHEA